MKKVYISTVCVLLLSGQALFGRGRSLANEDKSGLYAKSIEQVLRLDEEEVDLATAALIVSEQWSDLVYGRRYLSDLDDMALEIFDRLEEKGLGADYRAIAVINEYLFDELRFKSVKEADDPDDLFLHSVLDRKRGYCLSLSILYLSLGERLGLSLYGVVVPEHFFVRYDDGRVRFNIETTGKGGSASDEHYIEKFKVPEDDEGVYMLNLNKIQTLGCLFNNLGNTYCEVGNIDAAQLALERAVEINPSLAESRTNLGNIYLRKDRIEDAIYQYVAALKMKPEDAKTHNNLGNAYTQKGWLNDAVSEYTYSIELDPNFTEAYKNLANVYCKQGMFGRALSQLRQAIGLEPEDAYLHSQMGMVYCEMGRYEDAMFQYKKALRIKGDLADAHYGLGLCYNKLGRAKDEIGAYKKALAIEPDMVAALANLGNAYFSQEKYDAAIGQYKQAVRVSPADGSLHYNLGAAYSNKGEYEQAVVEYTKAIQLEPEMGDAHNGLAFAYYKLEKYPLAAEHIAIASELGVEISAELLAAIEDEL
ncbi:MAG: tetratricopeptide repeat protein [Planctomycetota bacterium]|nr:MAG: tetratricopeptide repeat protein [Planctomycetota bacterium]